jgi:CDP-paratose 2-epimerase
MKILVTGGAGFIGSHICEHYARDGNEVIAFDDLSRARMLKIPTELQELAFYNWNFLKKHKQIRLVQGDVRDLDSILKLMDDVEIIFHTAGQVAVTTSIIDPLTDYQINAYGTLNVCESARKSGNNPLIIFCSTNKVYGDLNLPLVELIQRYSYKDINGVNEEYPLEANCPYGASKISAEMILQSYFKTYGIPTIRARLSCIYGPRQLGCEDQAWVAHFVISTLTRKPITIYGDGKQVRDILYVTDLVRAFVSLVKNKNTTIGQVYNIGGGPENSISLLETLDLLNELTGLRSRIEFSNWRVGDQRIYLSDISKVQGAIGWKPLINISEGIDNLVKWYRSNLASSADN